MPLRDHFRSPINDKFSWDGLHGLWPGTIIFALARILPPEFFATPKVRHGAFAEIDIGAFEDTDEIYGSVNGDSGGGVATALATETIPTIDVAIDSLATDEYEVLIYDTRDMRRLVAAIEIVSPANKDRPESRRAFVAKCAALLQQQVSVTIIDVVTIRNFNLFREVLEVLGVESPSSPTTPTYATTCRTIARPAPRKWRFKAWDYPLAVGQPLPVLQLWLADDVVIPLDLNTTYEDTCRALRIP